jgi:hypothetical protein
VNIGQLHASARGTFIYRNYLHCRIPTGVGKKGGRRAFRSSRPFFTRVKSSQMLIAEIATVPPFPVRYDRYPASMAARADLDRDERSARCQIHACVSRRIT